MPDRVAGSADLAQITFSRDRSADARRPDSSPDAVKLVNSVLDRPDADLDYAKAKIAFDGFIDPSVDADQVLAELGQLTDAVRTMAGAKAGSDEKLSALRQFLYDAGPWNNGRVFSYDQSDPLGRRIENQLLHNYLANGLGQCVSMPILFLILAEKLGLDVALAAAPEHLFVRYSDSTGQTINIETTSGGHPARDIWVRQNFPMTDRSIETGIYMRSLTKRKAIATMASTVVEGLRSQGRLEEIIDVANVMLAHDPMNVSAMLWKGSACGRLLSQFRAAFPHFWQWTPAQRARVTALIDGNSTCFARAEHLGWVEPADAAPAGATMIGQPRG